MFSILQYYLILWHWLTVWASIHSMSVLKKPLTRLGHFKRTRAVHLWCTCCFRGFTYQKHDMIMRNAIVEGSTNFDHLGFFNTQVTSHSIWACSILPPSKCGCHGQYLAPPSSLMTVFVKNYIATCHGRSQDFKFNVIFYHARYTQRWRGSASSSSQAVTHWLLGADYHDNGLHKAVSVWYH